MSSGDKENNNTTPKGGKITELHTRRSYEPDDKMSFAGKNITLESLIEAAQEQGIEEGIFIGLGPGGNVVVTTNVEKDPMHIIGVIDYSKQLFLAVVNSQMDD